MEAGEVRGSGSERNMGLSQKGAALEPLGCTASEERSLRKRSSPWRAFQKMVGTSSSSLLRPKQGKMSPEHSQREYG